MRIKVTVETERIQIPYEFAFLSIIKNSLAMTNEELFCYLNTEKRNKPFVYSVYLSGYEMKEDHFYINGHIDWYISGMNEWVISIYNGLRRKKEYYYNGYVFRIKHISLVKEKEIRENTIVGRTLSSVYIQDKEKKALSPLHNLEGYNKELNYICNHVLADVKGRTLLEPLFFQPILMKKMIKKLPLDKTNGKEICLETWKGDFVLRGHREDLSLLSTIGLGFRRSQGYGMFQVL